MIKRVSTVSVVQLRPEKVSSQTIGQWVGVVSLHAAPFVSVPRHVHSDGVLMTMDGSPLLFIPELSGACYSNPDLYLMMSAVTLVSVGLSSGRDR